MTTWLWVRALLPVAGLPEGRRRGRARALSRLASSRKPRSSPCLLEPSHPWRQSGSPTAARKRQEHASPAWRLWIERLRCLHLGSFSPRRRDSSPGHHAPTSSCDMGAGGRSGDSCAPGWKGGRHSMCAATVKGGRYGHRICDEHRRDRRSCIRTCSVTCPAMGRRCDRVLSPPSVLGCMGAPDRLPTVCPGLSVVALDGGGCSALWLCSSMRAQDDLLLRVKALLEPFGIARYDTDNWGTYERHVDTEQHTLVRSTYVQVSGRYH